MWSSGAGEYWRGAASSAPPGHTRSHQLEAHRDGAAATVAEGGHAALQAALLQGVEQGHDQARAGRADRVAERDRAAVDVELVPVPAEHLPVRQDLGGERLVDLE